MRHTSISNVRISRIFYLIKNILNTTFKCINRILISLTIQINTPARQQHNRQQARNRQNQHRFDYRKTFFHLPFSHNYSHYTISALILHCQKINNLNKNCLKNKQNQTSQNHRRAKRNLRTSNKFFLFEN